VTGYYHSTRGFLHIISQQLNKNLIKAVNLTIVKHRYKNLGDIASMSLQQFKAKLLAVSLFTVSACGTFAIFGSVPVVARIASAPPFSIGKIEAFLLQQAHLSPAPAPASSSQPVYTTPNP
jgi:hypothetical protein